MRDNDGSAVVNNNTWIDSSGNFLAANIDLEMNEIAPAVIYTRVQ